MIASKERKVSATMTAVIPLVIKSLIVIDKKIIRVTRTSFRITRTMKMAIIKPNNNDSESRSKSNR